VADGQLEDELTQCLVRQQLGQDGFQADCEAFGRQECQLLKTKPREEGSHVFELDAVSLRESPGDIIDEDPIIQDALDEARFEQVTPLVRNSETSSEKRERWHQPNERDTVSNEHPPELGRHTVAVVCLGQVVKRAEAQYSIEAAVSPSTEVASVALDDRFDLTIDAGLVDPLPGKLQDLMR